MSDLHTATVIADADLADDVELPARLSGAAGLLRITLAKIKLYLSTALVLVPTGGATGDVLTKVSATDHDVHWAAPTGGGGGGEWTLLDTQTVSAVASFVWDNTKIAAPYNTFKIEFTGVNGSTTTMAVVSAQLSPDNGVTWRTTGFLNSWVNWGLTTNFQSYTQNGFTGGLVMAPSTESDATEPTNGKIEIFGVRSSAIKTASQGRQMGKMNDGNVYMTRNGAFYNTAAEAHNAIKVLPSAGTMSGTFRLYGRV